MHQYESAPEVVALVLRTYASVFDEVAIWYDVGSDLLILGMQGGRDSARDLARIEERYRRPDYAASLQRSGVRTLPELLAHELVPFGVVRSLGLEGPVHTLFHPRLSHEAGIAFFAGAGGALPPVPAHAVLAAHESSLLGRYASRFRGDLPDAERALVAREICPARANECIALLADWQRRRPASPLFLEVLREADGRGLTQWGGAVQTTLVARLADTLEGRRNVGPGEAEEIRRAYYHPSVSVPGARNGAPPAAAAVPLAGEEAAPIGSDGS
jgi:hypothetical protein